MRYGLIVMLSFFTACSSPGLWYQGSWQVVDVRFPGISAMDNQTAEHWFGEMLVYAPAQVHFQKVECFMPVYSQQTLSEAEFYRAYRVMPASLDIEPGSEGVRILQVGCPDNWIEPPASFIDAGGARAYMLWDGAFFLLQKKSY